MHITTETTNASSSSFHYTVAVIGGGPIGMHILSRAISEGIVPAEETVVIDPHSEPFAQWHRRVRNCRMPFLRSPASHGISRDFRAIRRSIRKETDFTAPYHRPAVSLFAEHLERHSRETVVGTRHIRGTAEEIYTGESGSDYRIAVFRDGTRISVTVDVIILAVGQPAPSTPQALQSLPEGAPLLHVHNDTSSLDLLPSGSEIALVGGGIAAAHLAVAFSQAGHQVAVWNRDRFTSHQFDSDPCFVGPRCSSLFAAIDDYQLRRALIQRSRRSGSVPPDLFHQLRDLEYHRKLRIIRGETTHATNAGSRVFLHGRKQLSPTRSGSPRTLRLTGEYDAVVACTGFSPGPPAGRLIQHMSREFSLKRATDGYPVPAADLQWAPGLFVAGALAELEIGPPARNLVGAHLAGRRILPALRHLLTARKSH